MADNEFLIEITANADQAISTFQRVVTGAGQAAQATGRYFADQNALADKAAASMLRYQEQVAAVLTKSDDAFLASMQRQTQAMVALDRQRQAAQEAAAAESVRIERQRLADIVDANRNAARNLTNSNMNGPGLMGGAMTYDQARGNANYIQNFKGNTGVGLNGWMASMQAGGSEKEAQQLLATMNAVGVSVAKNKTMFDEFASKFKSHALLLPAYLLTWEAAAVAMQSVTKAFSDSVKIQQEQAVQRFYFQANGKGTNPGQQEQALEYSIALSRLYGQEVTHVQEAVGLWAKVTHGELLPSIVLANDALKLSTISGMNQEEIYRSTVATLGQLHQPLSRTADLFNVATAMALRFGGGLKSLEGESQDSVKQMMDGMDAASTILGKTGMHLEEIGAMSAVVSHLTKETGETAGRHLAAAFAALESPKPEAALRKIGISLKDNSNLLVELGQHAKEVAGILENSRVRQQDKEALITAINNVGLIQSSADIGRKAEKSHPMDALFEQLQQTTLLQMSQLKSSFEALTFLVTREFLPSIQGVVTWMTNGLLPALITNAAGIAHFIQGGIKLLEIFAAWKALTFIGPLFKGISEAAVAAGDAIVVSGSVASTAWGAAMTKIGLSSVGAETVVSGATSEMQIAAMAFAGITGKSVGVVVSELEILEKQAVNTSTVVMGADEAMSLAVQNYALQNGIALERVEMQMKTLQTTAETTAVGVSGAFMKMIPVIGQALMAAQIGYMAYGAIKSWSDNKFNQEMMDPHKRKDRIAYDNRILHMHGGSAALKQHARDDLHNIHNIATGNTAVSHYQDSLKAIEAQQKKLSDQMQKDLKNMYISSGHNVTSPDAAATAQKAAKGPTDYTVATDGLKNLNAQKELAIRLDNLQVMADTTKIHSLERHIKLTDDLKQQIHGLNEINAINLDRTRHLNKENALLDSKIGGDAQAVNHAMFMAAHAKNAKEKDGWLGVEDQAIGRLEQDTRARQANTDSITANTDALAQNFNTVLQSASKDLGHLEKYQFNLPKTLHGKEEGHLAFVHKWETDRIAIQRFVDKLPRDLRAIGTQLFAQWNESVSDMSNAQVSTVFDLARSIHDRLTSGMDSLTGGMFKSAAIFEDTLSPNKKIELKYTEELVQHYQELNKYNKEYKDLALNVGPKDADYAELQAMRQMIDAWDVMGEKAIEYKKRVEEIQASSFYKATEAAFKVLDSLITSSLSNLIDGKSGSDQRLMALGQQSNEISGKKQLVDDYYNASHAHSMKQIADHQAYIRTLDEEERKIKAAEEAEKYRAAHPNALKQVAAAFTKSLVDDFLKQMQTKAMQKIFHLEPDKAMTDNVNKMEAIIKSKVSGSMASNTEALTIAISSGPQSFYKSVQQFVDGTNKFAQAMSGGSGVHGPGASKPDGSFSWDGYDYPTGVKGGSSGSWLSMNLPKILQGVGGAAAGFGVAAGGVQQGGFGGALSAFVGTDSAIGSIAGMFSGGFGAMLSAAAPYIAAAIAAYALLSHHDNPANMPDKYATQAFGQGMADLQGSGINGTPVMTANGQQFSIDSQLSQALGNQGELAYISAYIAKTGGAGLTQAEIAEFKGATSITSQSKDGNMVLNNGVTVRWDQLVNDGSRTANAIEQLNAKFAQTGIVSFNQFGSGIGFFPYNWATPGYEMQSGNNTGVNGGNPLAPGAGGGTGGGGGGRGRGGRGDGTGDQYAYNPPSGGSGAGMQSSMIQTTVNLDGREIARSTQSYQVRALGAGFTYVN